MQAGDFSEAIDVYEPGFAETWVESPSSAGKHSFWLRVIGDSMTSPHGMSIPEGMLILVEPDLEARNGSLVVAKVNGEVTFKKLVIDAGRRFLKPLNPAYPAIDIDDRTHIVGVVKEAKHIF